MIICDGTAGLLDVIGCNLKGAAVQIALTFAIVGVFALLTWIVVAVEAWQRRRK
jgi:hypothetical protein